MKAYATGRYGRLNVSGTVLSKRKIIELVNKKHVRAWDDPRLYTLIALRRRGVPPGAILSFVNELGVTKATSNIELKRFETSIRHYLENTVPRLMLLLEPLAVVIGDLPDYHLEMVEVPFSKDPAYGVCSHCFSPPLAQHCVKNIQCLGSTIANKLSIVTDSHTRFPSPKNSTSSAATSAK